MSDTMLLIAVISASCLGIIWAQSFAFNCVIKGLKSLNHDISELSRRLRPFENDRLQRMVKEEQLAQYWRLYGQPPCNAKENQ